MPRQQARSPQVRWDDDTWHVTLPLEDGRVIDANWKPGMTYVVRIREALTEQWSFGFKTPITGFTFVDLKPDTRPHWFSRAPWPPCRTPRPLSVRCCRPGS